MTPLGIYHCRLQKLLTELEVEASHIRRSREHYLRLLETCKTPHLHEAIVLSWWPHLQQISYRAKDLVVRARSIARATIDDLKDAGVALSPNDMMAAASRKANIIRQISALDPESLIANMQDSMDRCDRVGMYLYSLYGYEALQSVETDSSIPEALRADLAEVLSQIAAKLQDKLVTTIFNDAEEVLDKAEDLEWEIEKVMALGASDLHRDSREDSGNHSYSSRIIH